uniref:Uncharacterized protein n=1 Tax=Timspurckia oligopyrenoides TaxID=708627 RepID=A0A7S0ZKD3_9RHOD
MSWKMSGIMSRVVGRVMRGDVFARSGVITRRGYCVAAEAMPTKSGPRLPAVGPDPGAFHSPEHMAAETKKWRRISYICTPFVFLYGIYAIASGEHPSEEAPPAYDYIGFRNRVPSFPWGEGDLIGTPYQRAAAGKGHH